MSHEFFNNKILIEVEDDITFEEQEEILDLIKQVLRRKKENRKIKLLDDFIGRIL